MVVYKDTKEKALKLSPGNKLVNASGQDIVRKPSRRSRIMMVLPSTMSFGSGTEGQLGVLEKANSSNPEFVIPLDYGELRFVGKFVPITTSYYAISVPAKRGGSAVCEDVFNTVLLFDEPKYTKIDKKDKDDEEQQQEDQQGIVDVSMSQESLNTAGFDFSQQMMDESQATMDTTDIMGTQDTFQMTQGTIGTQMMEESKTVGAASPSSKKSAPLKWSTHIGCSSLADPIVARNSKDKDINTKVGTPFKSVPAKSACKGRAAKSNITYIESDDDKEEEEEEPDFYDSDGEEFQEPISKGNNASKSYSRPKSSGSARKSSPIACKSGKLVFDSDGDDDDEPDEEEHDEEVEPTITTSRSRRKSSSRVDYATMLSSPELDDEEEPTKRDDDDDDDELTLGSKPSRVKADSKTKKSPKQKSKSKSKSKVWDSEEEGEQDEEEQNDDDDDSEVEIISKSKAKSKVSSKATAENSPKPKPKSKSKTTGKSTGHMEDETVDLEMVDLVSSPEGISANNGVHGSALDLVDTDADSPTRRPQLKSTAKSYGKRKITSDDDDVDDEKEEAAMFDSDDNDIPKKKTSGNASKRKRSSPKRKSAAATPHSTKEEETVFDSDEFPDDDEEEEEDDDDFEP